MKPGLWAQGELQALTVVVGRMGVQEVTEPAVVPRLAVAVRLEKWAGLPASEWAVLRSAVLSEGAVALPVPTERQARQGVRALPAAWAEAALAAGAWVDLLPEARPV